MEVLKNITLALKEFFKEINDLFDIELFKMGDSHITIGTFSYVLFSIILLVFLSGILKKRISKSIIKKYKINPGTVLSIATITRYTVLMLGVVIILNSAGVDLSAIGILAGALGVGIGFGLQNITNNFISGLIILFEQPIRVGDRVTVGDIEGDVIKIASRATTINTNDNITLIIPNSEFISNKVINWSHNDRNVSLRFPVSVSYKEDPEQVRKALLEICLNEEGILENPKPEVLFTEFGNSSLNFDLRIWTTDYINRPRILKSKLYFKIFVKFKEEGIEIPYPQRDIHFKSSDLPEGWTK